MLLFCGEGSYASVVTGASLAQRNDKLISGKGSGLQLELQASGIPASFYCLSLGLLL